MWGLPRLMVFSLSIQAALGQLQYRVLEVHHINSDGSTHVRPSGEDRFGAAVSLRTTGANGVGDNAGLALDPPQGVRDVTAQDYDGLDARELRGGVFKAIIKITKVVISATAAIGMAFEINKDDDPPVIINNTVTIDGDGNGDVTIIIDEDLINSDGTGFCDACKVKIEAGDCEGDCDTYDKDATNNNTQLDVLEISGDPHMVGMLGQKFDWSGQDNGWCCLVSDGPDFHLNVRVTAPMPEEFPDRQLVSAVSIVSSGGPSVVIEVKDPYTIDTEGCGDDSSLPCLADGALRVIVDGVEQRGFQVLSEAVELPGGSFVSSANLPVECRPFGGDRIWAAKHAEMAADRRFLRAREQKFDEWILDVGSMAAPTWCAKFLEEKGLPGLLAVQSNHAIFRVVTPTASLRINIGVNYQDRVTSEDGATILVPELEFWQGDLGVERSTFSDTVSGMLGETSRPVLHEHGLPVMEGLGAIRGTPENYRVDGPYAVEFEQLLHQ